MNKIKVVLIVLLLGMASVVALGAEELPLCEIQYADENESEIDQKFKESIAEGIEAAVKIKNIHRVRQSTNIGAFFSTVMREAVLEDATEEPDYLILMSFAKGNAEGEYSLRCTLNKNDRQLVRSTPSPETVKLSMMGQNELQEVCNKLVNALYTVPDARNIKPLLYRVDGNACLEWTGAATDVTDASLEYKVIYSKDKDDVTNVELAKKLGIKISSSNWLSENDEHKQSFALEPDINYYFAVLVKNEIGCYAVSSVKGSSRFDITARMGGTLTLTPEKNIPGEKIELKLESDVGKTEIKKSFMLSDGTWQINMHYDGESVNEDDKKVSIDSLVSLKPEEVAFKTVSDSFLQKRLDFGRNATNSSIREEAFKDAATAEDKGIAGQAMYELGCLYEKEEDFESAVEWYKKGEEKKDDASKTALINLYYNRGRFFEDEEDFDEAMKWYSLGKEKKDDRSKNALVDLYYKLGQNGEENGNDECAISWYKAGVAEKHSDSKLALAKIYAKQLDGYKNDRNQYDEQALDEAREKCKYALKLFDEDLKNSYKTDFENLQTIQKKIEKRIKDLSDDKTRQENWENFLEATRVQRLTKRNRTAWYLDANVRYSPIYRSFPVSSEFKDLPWVYGVTWGSMYGFFPCMFAGLECDFGSWWDMNNKYEGRPTFTLSPMVLVGLNTDFFGNDWANYYLVFGGGVFIPWNETAVGTPHPKFRAGIGIDFYPGGKQNTGDFFFNIEYTADYTMGMGFDDRIKIGIGWYLDKPGTWRQGIVESYRACVRPEDGQNQSKKTGR